MSQPPHDPPPETRNLSHSLETLNGLRDKLTLALATLEQNTDRISAWLKNNREAIIIRRHQMARAIAKKDAAALSDILLAIDTPVQERDEVFAFVLSDGVLLDAAIATWGQKHDVVKRLQLFKTGLPARLIEDIPDIAISDDFDDAVARTAETVEKTRQTPAPAPKKDNALGNLFKTKAARQAEEAEAQAHALVAQWQQLHRELLSLQSDRHYYIDSFMDWIGENLAPDEASQNLAAVMTRYRHPAYMLQQAKTDYTEALETRSQSILRDATAYSTIAGRLDAQDIAGFITSMKDLFRDHTLATNKEIRALLLRDFDASSFADLAFDYVEKPEDKLALLTATAQFEGRLTIKGKSDDNTIFRHILNAVIAGTLPPEALALLSRTSKTNVLDIAVHNNAFTAVFDAFNDDDETLSRALTTLTGAKEAVTVFVNLHRALQDNDAIEAEKILVSLDNPWQKGPALSKAVNALRQLCQPQASLVADLRRVSGADAALLARLLMKASTAGIGGEIARDETVATLLDDIFIPSIDKITPSQLRQIIATACIPQQNEALAGWRESLAGPNGFLARIANDARLDTPHKLACISALLAPLPSLYQKAALLLETAKALSTAGQSAAQFLHTTGLSLTSGVLQVNGRALLINADKIDNIWYVSTDGGALKTIINGQLRQLVTGIDVHEAKAIMTVLSEQAPNLLHENGGLFNAATADRIIHNGDESDIIWDNIPTPLRIDDTMRTHLKSLDGYIHATSNGIDISFNINSILAVLPCADGWAVIDHRGRRYDVDAIRMSANTGPLLAMGKTYFNPQRSSFLSFSSVEDAVVVNCEAPNFKKLLEDLQAEDDLSQYVNKGRIVLDGSHAQWQTAENAVKSSPTFLAADAVLPGFYFNLETMEYLSFYYYTRLPKLTHGARYWASAQNPLNAPDGLEAALADAAKKCPRALVITKATVEKTPVIIDRDAILHAYYKPGSETLYLNFPHDSLAIPVSEKTARAVLTELAGDAGYVATHVNDVIHEVFLYDRTTYIDFDKESDNVRTMIDGRVIPIILSEKKFIDWSKQLIQQGQNMPAASAANHGALTSFSANCNNLRQLPASPSALRPYDTQDLLSQLRAMASNDAGSAATPAAQKPAKSTNTRKF